jgi:hypothetical protein
MGNAIKGPRFLRSGGKLPLCLSVADIPTEILLPISNTLHHVFLISAEASQVS